MDCEKDPFSIMSQDEIKKNDEVLKSAQAKALLMDSKVVPFVPDEIQNAIIKTSLGSEIVALSDLDNLVLDPPAGPSLFPINNDEDAVNVAEQMLQDNVSAKTVEYPMVLLDHNYSLTSGNLLDVVKPRRESLCKIQSEDLVIEPAETTAPRRRSKRQIEKVERKQTEKIKIETAASELKDEEEEESSVKPRLAPVLEVPKENGQNGHIESRHNVLNEIVQKKENKNTINFADALLTNNSVTNEEQVITPAIIGKSIVSAKANKKLEEEILASSRNMKEKMKTVDSKDIRKVVANSKNRRKSSDSSQTNDSTCVSPSKDYERDIKSVKRRKSDSVSSSSSEMSLSPTKSGTPKFEGIFQNKKNENKNVTPPNGPNPKGKVSFPNKSPTNSKEVDKKRELPISKARKKSLSFSEDKDEVKIISAEKKRHLSSSGKDSNSVQNTNVKLKPNKPKKRISKTDMISLDLLGPALFSQPHKVGKVRLDEAAETKEVIECKPPNKELVNDSSKSNVEPVKSESQENEVNELDLIRAEVELEQKESKAEAVNSSNVDVKNSRRSSVSKVDKTSVSETSHASAKVNRDDKSDVTKTKPGPMKDQPSKSVNNSTPTVNRSSQEKNKLKTSSSAEKVEKAVAEEVVKDVQKSSREKKNISYETLVINETEINAAKVAQPQPERKSQRTAKKRKRIYEDDSDFEELSITASKRTVPEKEKIVEESEEVASRRSQRQKSTAKIMKNSKDSDGDDEDDDEDEEEEQVEAEEKENESSEEEEEQEEDDEKEDDEDDPNKLWCICRQPHNNKFMICCDKCEDWFHGTCVGITRKMGQLLETEEKEWLCPNCKKGIIPNVVPEKSTGSSSKSNKQASANKAAAAKKNVQAASKQNNEKSRSTRSSGTQSLKEENKIQSPKTQQKGRAVKNEAKDSEELMKQKTAKTPEKIDPKAHLLKKIDERKEIVLMKRDPTVKKTATRNQVKQQQTSPKKETSPEKPVKVETNMSVHKTLPSKEISVKSPTKEKPNLPKNNVTAVKTPIKSIQSSNVQKIIVKGMRGQLITTEKTNLNSGRKKLSASQLREQNLMVSLLDDCVVKKKNECIVCSQPSSAGSIYCSNTCLEKYIAESLREILNQKHFLKENEDYKAKKIVVVDRLSGHALMGNDAPTLGNLVEFLKSNPMYEIVSTSPISSKRETPQKKEVESKPVMIERSDDEESAKEGIRTSVRKSLKSKFIDRCKDADDIKLSEEEIEKIVLKIEDELHKHLTDSSKYKKKYRSLLFNIQDSRNKGLFRKILTGQIAPDDLVKMSTDQLAAPELAQWRAMENQHSLDMIKRMQVDQQQQQAAGVRKKTHKGEIEIEDEVTRGLEPEIDKELPATPPPRPIEETVEVSPEKKEKEAEKNEENDTTNFHRSHLFDLNCKICTGKMAPPPPDEPLPKKVRVAHSISVEQSSPKSSEKLVSPITNVPSSSTPGVETSDDSVDREPTSSTHISPDSSTPQIQHVPKKPQLSVWKGRIFMQDVTQFLTNAFQVSGPTDFMPQDIPDTIEVCGRIVPDQVFDYLSKIKQSGNKELIIVRFQAANDEARAPYQLFYMYLYSRRRYGVVNCCSKMVKDFYIFPLAAHNPVPTVLMPFDGPGLPSRRPNLLLGILVRHKGKQSALAVSLEDRAAEDVDASEGSYTPPLDSRSYTPPLPSAVSSDPVDAPSYTPTYIPTTLDDPALEVSCDGNSYEPSYTPPLEDMPKMDVDCENEDNEKPYDPEQNFSPKTPPLTLYESETPSASNAFSELLKKITDGGAGASSPVPTTTSSSSSLDQHLKMTMLNVLSREVEESDTKENLLGTEFDEQNMDTQSQGSTIDDSIIIPGMNASGMSSFLDLPENLQEILNSVRSSEHSSLLRTSKKDTDIRRLPEQIKADTDLRGLTESKQDEDIRYIPAYSPASSEGPVTEADDHDSSQGATPPPPCDDDNDSPSELRPSDPRIKIRTNFVEEPKKVSLSDMSTSELMERAQKELESIPPSEAQSGPAMTGVNTDAIIMDQGYATGWDRHSEPPPPGIDPSELPLVENVTFASSKLVPDPTFNSQAENHVVVSPFPPQSPSTPAGFNVSVPPPGFPLTTPPPGMDASKTFPPPAGILPPTFLPPPPIPPPPIVTPSVEAGERVDDRYPPWPPEGRPSDLEWQDRHWREREPEWADWDERSYPSLPSDYYRDRDPPENWRRSRHRRDYYPDDFPDDAPPRLWEEGDVDQRYDRHERSRWYSRRSRDNRRNESFRGRRNFQRQHRD